MINSKTTMTETKCDKCYSRVSVVTVLVNTLMFSLKLIVGIISGSHALIANSFYSVQNVVTSLFLALGLRQSTRIPDEKYPYGYGKLEYIFSFVLSLLIIGGALIVSIFAGRNIFLGSRHPSWLAFWAVSAAFLANTVLLRYVECAADVSESPALITNARHIHADVLSGICIALGIVITKMGFSQLDSLIAIVEVVHITVVSVGILKISIDGMLDTSLGPDKVGKITDAVEKTAGVRRIVSLRTRRLGQTKEISCEIAIDGADTIENSGRVKKEIASSLQKAIGNNYLLNITVIPANEEIENKKKREAVIETLRQYYNYVIQSHKLEVDNESIHITLKPLPGIKAADAEKIADYFRKKLEAKFKHDKITVEISEKKKEEKNG